MKNIYIIGGSPCSGKSTIAEIIADKYDFLYIKADYYIDNCMRLGAEKGLPLCSKISKMSVDETWLRNPEAQCKDELAYYEEIFPLLWEDLQKSATNTTVITEGAAYLPQLMKRMRIPDDRYIAVVPEKQFQIMQYRKRDWVKFVLADCSDKEAAFKNWMERDALFALDVLSQCEKTGYGSIINDGKDSIDDMEQTVCRHFHL